MPDRIEACPSVSAEPLGIVISSGTAATFESPAAFAFVWGGAEIDDETRIPLAA